MKNSLLDAVLDFLNIAIIYFWYFFLEFVWSFVSSETILPTYINFSHVIVFYFLVGLITDLYKWKEETLNKNFPK